MIQKKKKIANLNIFSHWENKVIFRYFCSTLAICGQNTTVSYVVLYRCKLTFPITRMWRSLQSKLAEICMKKAHSLLVQQASDRTGFNKHNNDVIVLLGEELAHWEPLRPKRNELSIFESEDFTRCRRRLNLRRKRAADYLPSMTLVDHSDGTESLIGGTVEVGGICVFSRPINDLLPLT